MPPLGTREIEVCAQVLERHLSGESHLRLHLLCPVNGQLVGLWRISRKPNGPPAPDLFDIATFQLRSGSKNMWFVQEFTLQHHHDGIARRYRSLQAATLWAQFLWKNLLHAEDCRAPSLLCAQVIAAFASHDTPSCTLLKALFSHARSEGYAVKEDWLRGLSLSMRQRATRILTQPLSELTAEDESVAADALLPSLHRWLGGNTDFDLPATGSSSG